MIAKRVRRWIVKASQNLTIRMWSSMTVQRVDSVALVDVRQKSDDFQNTIVAALDLLRKTDGRRYRRVTNGFDWIVNQELSTGGAEYQHWARACIINFEETWPGRDIEFSIGWHAAVLIHEATHAYLEGLGIRYDDSSCARIERLCVEEQNRWAAKLDDQALGQKIHQQFDPKDWDFCWNGTKYEHFESTIRNMFAT